MTSRKQRRAELDDLLVRAVTEPLDPAESLRLDELLKEFPDVDATGYERAAAAILLASLTEEPMPESLKQRILADAQPS